MTADEEHQAIPGRHRRPSQPTAKRTVRVALAVIAVLACIGLAVGIGRTFGGDMGPPVESTPAPSSGSPSESTTSSPSPSGTAGRSGSAPVTSPAGRAVSPAAPTSRATGGLTGTTPSPAKVVAPAGVPAGVARNAAGQLAALARLQKAGVPGAPVVAAPAGERRLTGPGVTVGTWEKRTLPNKMTLAANNERALLAGRVVAVAKLGRKDSSRQVTLPSGRRITVPIASSYGSFMAMRAAGGPACPACRDVVVTSATATTMPVRTNLGTMSVPAWRFAIRDSTVVFVQPAIGETGLLRFTPAYRSSVPAAVDKTQLQLWNVGVGKAPRTLTAVIDPKDVARRKGCWRLVAQESPTAVALYAAKGRADGTGPCADRKGRVTVKLAKPLGARVVVDTYWHRALALGGRSSKG